MINVVEAQGSPVNGAANSAANGVVNIIVAEANEMNCQLVQSAFRPKRFRVAVVASAVQSSQTVALLKDRPAIAHPRRDAARLARTRPGD
jgi:hypothetical protein